MEQGQAAPDPGTLDLGSLVLHWTLAGCTLELYSIPSGKPLPPSNHQRPSPRQVDDLHVGLISITRRRHEPPLRLPRRELASLRRWLEASAGARLQTANPLRLDRRDAGRQPLETRAELRPISAGGIGLVRPAVVRDVSPEGIALHLDEPLPGGQRISLEIHPPENLPRRPFRRADGPIQILAVVRYCRPDGGRHVLGCSFGVEWADSLANEMFPADLRARRSA